MGKSYRRADVLKELDARGGTFTTHLAKRAFGWNPANLRNPIQGPVEKITWTKLADGRVSLDVTRGHHGRIEMGVQHQHTVSAEPAPDRATVEASQRRGKRILRIVLVIYGFGFVVGALVGTALVGKASYLGIVFGGLAGYLSCAVVLRTIVMVIAARRRRPPAPSPPKVAD